MSVAPTNQTTGDEPLTLGELLYSDPAMTLVSEKQWRAVVRAIAAGDESALRLLYEKAFPVLSTYLLRLTGDRHLTDTLILDVFQMVWCEAPVFDSTQGPVLGWIMRQARTLALTQDGNGRLVHRGSASAVLEVPTGPIPVAPVSVVPVPVAPLPVDNGGSTSASNLSFQRALAALTGDERQAIEATFLNGLSYAECAARSGQPIGTIKSRIRSGLAKLQAALRPRGEES